MSLFYFDLTALISFAFRLSALEFCSDTTAHMAAGIHPMSVICRIRHKRAVRSFPLNRKDSEGKNMAIKVIIVFSFNGLYNI